MNAAPRCVWPLAGPTASGKTEVAHLLAERMGARILSVDSMLVYRGMDVGTDKPPPEARRRFGYAGIDLANPDDSCDVARWLAAARVALDGFEGPWIAVGGTGLYFRCLLQGLDPSPPADPAARAEAEELLARDGSAALYARLRDLAPEVAVRLRDPRNPRRLVRAWEIARAGGGHPPDRRWGDPPRLVGLRRAPADLRHRIALRARRMFGAGLLEEARELRRRFPRWSSTAMQAIGYREAFAALDGRMTPEEAVAAVAARTVRLARRQMTWFRHQARTEWVDAEPNSAAEALAGRIERIWRQEGPSRVAV